jgi:hypothetical protein
MLLLLLLGLRKDSRHLLLPLQPVALLLMECCCFILLLHLAQLLPHVWPTPSRCCCA